MLRYMFDYTEISNCFLLNTFVLYWCYSYGTLTLRKTKTGLNQKRRDHTPPCNFNNSLCNQRTPRPWVPRLWV